MNILITGGAGFLGQQLIRALLDRGQLDGGAGSQPIRRIVCFDQTEGAIVDPRVRNVAGSISDAATVDALVDDTTQVVVHLAAVVSSQSEDDFDLGMRVNLDATQILFETCRRIGHCPKVVFASSLAVYGGNLPEVVHDDTALNPKTSYGVQKAICELLLSDYSRKGFIDGRGLRLPTISVRPGKPNKAASSFASGIIREPLNGVDTVCPVTADMHLLLMSPRQAVECMIVAHDLGAEAFGQTHVLNLPGVTVTVGEMVEVLGKIAGLGATRKIHWEPDPAIQRIIGTWPTRWDARRAVMLGFKGDPDFESIVRAFIKDDLVG